MDKMDQFFTNAHGQFEGGLILMNVTYENIKVIVYLIGPIKKSNQERIACISCDSLEKI